MNTLAAIASLAGFLFVLVGVVCFINVLFDTHIGMRDAEIPADPVIGVFFLVLGAVLLLAPFLFRKLFRRSG